jgi:hypothetical protein
MDYVKPAFPGNVPKDKKLADKKAKDTRKLRYRRKINELP